MSDAALRICFELPQRTGRPNIGNATGRGVLPDERTGRPNIGNATGRGVLPDERTGRPNIGNATGRGVLPDGRIYFSAMLVEEEALPYARDLSRMRFSYKINRSISFIFLSSIPHIHHRSFLYRIHLYPEFQ
ncbi:hypothetical protein [Evansella tamaricis]|uniref:Uncharacterized protein n=1 Tax=Evansella tamaricis TaxID=2069301 RepID=A0ABS6JCX6_9BACI|nr:hypothetical protein [Evansella tamaricis]MBU9711501.1 hypothetical protein [Evansella tamaricis]